MRGVLISFEGLDSSGKTTQLALLKERLEAEGKKIAVFKFPSYEKTYYGTLIKRYLQGEFGEVKEVSPYLIGVIYALDRLEMRDAILAELDSGSVVLLDRYVASNKAHMGAKIMNKKKRDEFIKWVDELDFGKNKMPKEDLIIFLDVPVKNSLELMRIEHKKRDIHEKDIDYMNKVYEVYGEIAKKKKWARINCVDKDRMISKEKIVEQIYTKIKRILNNKIPLI